MHICIYIRIYKGDNDHYNDDVYIYIYTYVHTHVYIHICIYTLSRTVSYKEGVPYTHTPIKRHGISDRLSRMVFNFTADDTI
jgi:hypothetical protein